MLPTPASQTKEVAWGKALVDVTFGASYVYNQRAPKSGEDFHQS
jgi:hypothetical protein